MIVVLNSYRFGKNVRYLRTKMGLSQTRLAELAGMPVWDLRDLEAGRSMDVDSRNVQALCRILGRETQEMLNGDMIG